MAKKLFFTCIKYTLIQYQKIFIILFLPSVQYNEAISFFAHENAKEM